MNRLWRGRWRGMVALALTALTIGASPMFGTAVASSNIGDDISWPQCGRAFPTGSAFGIVGVSGGKPFVDNPCLSAEHQWAVATGVPAAFYMNTANPGPDTAALDWYGQRSPNAACSPADQAACAYNYGYNAARYAFSYANSRAAAGPGHTWWLDVETDNSWSRADLSANLADIAGSIDYLTSRGVVVGVYSTPYQWTRITGGARIPGLPNWAAGARDAGQAAAFCATKSFTGGPVLLAQFVEGDFDRNYPCPGAEAVLRPSSASQANPLIGLLSQLVNGLGLGPKG